MGSCTRATWSADRREAAVAAALVGAVVVIIGYASGLGVTTDRSNDLTMGSPAPGAAASPAASPAGAASQDTPPQGNGGGAATPPGGDPGTPPSANMPMPSEPTGPSGPSEPRPPAGPSAPVPPGPVPTASPTSCPGLLAPLLGGQATPSPGTSGTSGGGSLVGGVGNLVSTVTDPLLGRSCAGPVPATGMVPNAVPTP
jgi:hypothetical protein